MTARRLRPCLVSLSIWALSMIALSLQLSSLFGDVMIAVVVAGTVIVSAAGVTHGFTTKRRSGRPSV